MGVTGGLSRGENPVISGRKEDQSCCQRIVEGGMITVGNERSSELRLIADSKVDADNELSSKLRLIGWKVDFDTMEYIWKVELTKSLVMSRD